MQEEKSQTHHRFTLFKQAVSRGTADLRSLCLIEAVAQQHSYRMYLQIQTWLRNRVHMNEWEWKQEASIFSPFTTIRSTVPDSLLKNVFCSCKKGSGKGCGCRKLGMTLS